MTSPPVGFAAKSVGSEEKPLRDSTPFKNKRKFSGAALSTFSSEVSTSNDDTTARQRGQDYPSAASEGPLHRGSLSSALSMTPPAQTGYSRRGSGNTSPAHSSWIGTRRGSFSSSTRDMAAGTSSGRRSRQEDMEVMSRGASVERRAATQPRLLWSDLVDDGAEKSPQEQRKMKQGTHSTSNALGFPSAHSHLTRLVGGGGGTLKEAEVDAPPGIPQKCGNGDKNDDEEQDEEEEEEGESRDILAVCRHRDRLGVAAVSLRPAPESVSQCCDSHAGNWLPDTHLNVSVIHILQSFCI